MHTLPHSTARLERYYSFGTGHQVANVASHSCWEAHNRINQSERHRYGLLLFLLLVSYLHIFFPPSPTPSHVFSCIYARNVLQNRHLWVLARSLCNIANNRANTFLRNIQTMKRRVGGGPAWMALVHLPQAPQTKGGCSVHRAF